jgi:hypothetical protein
MTAFLQASPFDKQGSWSIPADFSALIAVTTDCLIAAGVASAAGGGKMSGGALLIIKQ